MERFAEARDRKTFTHDDQMAACSWMSCAVGEHGQQGTLVPANWIHVGPITGMEVGPYQRDGQYPVPRDGYLKNWGTQFYELVKANNVDAAEALFHVIGDRVLEIKREATQ